MNERYQCLRCGVREAVYSGGFCLSCDLYETRGLTMERRAASILNQYDAGSTYVAPEAPKPTNITNRKIRF